MNITEKDKILAEGCKKCPICSHARKTQRGLAFWLVSHVEDRICPQCKAYEKVYGRKAHAPLPPEEL